MPHTRREFLKTSAAAATLVAAAGSIPGFLTRSARAAFSPTPVDDRVLVIVQLSGGNDGLNTVVPFENDDYHNARPTLRVESQAVHRLTDELGLHPRMGALKGLYDDGALSVVTNVGYPNPDRSHFRSMDIWHTADVRPEDRDTGWIGRVSDRLAVPGAPPFAVHLDDAELPLALVAQESTAPSLRDIDSLRLQGDPRTLGERLGRVRVDASDDLQFVQRVAVSSCEQAARLERVDTTAGATQYPGFRLASRLQQIAQLIDSGFGARIYYTSIGGFDTHARQDLAHGPLLNELSESVAAFQRDLDRRALADRVVLMTFSEFGRRVKENGSRGTDHGAGAPMFLVGRPVAPGVHGDAPNLANLVEGDVPHDLDFRRVYATMLDRWLRVDSQMALGARYAPVKVL